MNKLKDTVWPMVEDEKIYSVMDREEFDADFSAFQHKSNSECGGMNGSFMMPFLFSKADHSLVWLLPSYTPSYQSIQGRHGGEEEPRDFGRRQQTGAKLHHPSLAAEDDQPVRELCQRMDASGFDCHY